MSGLSNGDGKCPWFSSSFGPKGNMTQMNVISLNRLGPAAQETHTGEKTHTVNTVVQLVLLLAVNKNMSFTLSWSFLAW